MKRIQYHRYGGPDEMRLEEYRSPPPGLGEILVRVRAASVNPVDWMIRQGAMTFVTGWCFPRGMGMDFSGVIQAIGPFVTRFKIGDEVFGSTPLRKPGAFSETVITKSRLAVKKPTVLSHEEAAALPVAGATAWTALVRDGKLKAGQHVFINGAYGGVGQAATHIAKALGASVTGRVGTASMSAAAAIGMDLVIDYNQKVPPSLAGRFDIVLDCHGSLRVTEGNMLRKRGGIVIDAVMSSYQKVICLSLFWSRKYVTGKLDTPTLQSIADLAGSGKLRVAIGRTVELKDGIDLIKDLEAGRRVNGKGIIVVA